MPTIVKSSAKPPAKSKTKPKSKSALRATAAGLKSKIKLKVSKVAARVGLAPRNGTGKHTAPAAKTGTTAGKIGRAHV